MTDTEQENAVNETKHESVGDVLAERKSKQRKFGGPSHDWYRDAMDRIERAHARESAAQVRVPDGWPTEEMRSAFEGTGRHELLRSRIFIGEFNARFRAALQAAPAPAAEPAPQPAQASEPVAWYAPSIDDTCTAAKKQQRDRDGIGNPSIYTVPLYTAPAPAEDAGFKVGDRVEWRDDDGERYEGVIRGYHVNLDDGSNVESATPSRLTRLTGGSHE